MDWEFGISRCKLVYTEWINNKDLLCKKQNYIHYLVIKHNGKEYEKRMCVYIYICITESLCCTAVIGTKLQFNYTSIKDNFFKKKQKVVAKRKCAL